jgi:hypothetical protein
MVLTIDMKEFRREASKITLPRCHGKAGFNLPQVLQAELLELHHV